MPLFVCVGCGASFARNKRRQGSCSRACGNRAKPRHSVSGPLNPNWKGGRSHNQGRPLIYAPDHPRAKMGNGRHVYEHLLIAELALGRPLPLGVEVHHVNEDKTDNRRCNLVLCENRAYHMLLHDRTRLVRGLPQRRDEETGRFRPKGTSG